MARDLTAGMVTQLTATSNRPVLFFEGEFSSGTLRFWTGSGVLNWDSKTWEGNGLLHGFQLATETEDIEATGVEIELSGVSEATTQLVLASAEMGRPGRLWLGMLNSSGVIIADPYKIFDGKFDTAEIVENAEASEITIKYETRLIELERGREWRYTPENQRLFNASDKGFDYVAGIQEWDGFWGPKAKPPEKKDKNKNKPKNSSKKKR